MDLRRIVDIEKFPILDQDFRTTCRSDPGLQKAYFCQQTHTAYLSPPDPGLPADHPRNRPIKSSKGCITDDQISQDSVLRTLYDSADFQGFLCAVLGEAGLYPYADPLSSINIHYAKTGQELGWHFDNSSFAITLMIQPAERGGQFEYIGAAYNSKPDVALSEGARLTFYGRTH